MASVEYGAAHRLLLRLLRQGGAWNILLLAAGLASAAAYIAFPAVLGRIVDAVLHGTDPGRFVAVAGLLVFLFVLTDAACELAVTSASARSTAWLRHRLIRHLLDLGPRRPARFTPGEAAGRVVSSTAEAGRVTPMAAWCATSVAPALGGLAALVVIDPLLGLVFLLATPLLIGLIRLLLARSSTAAVEYLRVQGEIGARLTEALAGARTIAAAGTQDREAERVLAHLGDLGRHGQRMWRAQGNIAAAGALLAPLLEVAVLGTAGVLLTRGRLSTGELLAASQYVLLAAGLPAPLAFLARFARARAAAARVTEVTSVAPPGYGETCLAGDGGGRLEFRAVTVRLAGQTVLRGLDLAVPAGALVAVVGRSGAGKSTLAALAGRLLDPDDGEVLLDGVPLPRLSRADLRRSVAYGFDRPVLIGRTVHQAVALGCPAPAELVVSAVRAARADEFVRRLPAGYGTSMANAPLSGGEAQRLGLARAFVRPARVLVLDDATSNLDTITELQISAVLTGELGGRTRLVVAHRAGTAARADLVAWLENGRVRRLATHEELWRDVEYRAVFGP